MYYLQVKEDVDKIFFKIAKKNSQQLRIINKKIEEIRNNPNHIYKFLKRPLQTYNRVHIDTHFVLIFKIDHNSKTVIVYYFDHHDNIYKWRPKV